MPREPVKREAHNAAWWLIWTMLCVLPLPGFIFLMLWWFRVRENAGIEDNATNYVFLGGFIAMVVLTFVCKSLASRHFGRMREANAEQRVQAHLAELRGDRTAISRALRYKVFLSLVPLIALLLAIVLLVLMM